MDTYYIFILPNNILNHIICHHPEPGTKSNGLKSHRGCPLNESIIFLTHMCSCNFIIFLSNLNHSPIKGSFPLYLVNGRKLQEKYRDDTCQKILKKKRWENSLKFPNKGKVASFIEQGATEATVLTPDLTAESPSSPYRLKSPTQTN